MGRPYLTCNPIDPSRLFATFMFRHNKLVGFKLGQKKKEVILNGLKWVWWVSLVSSWSTFYPMIFFNVYVPLSKLCANYLVWNVLVWIHPCQKNFKSTNWYLFINNKTIQISVLLTQKRQHKHKGFYSSIWKFN